MPTGQRALQEEVPPLSLRDFMTLFQVSTNPMDVIHHSIFSPFLPHLIKTSDVRWKVHRNLKAIEKKARLDGLYQHFKVLGVIEPEDEDLGLSFGIVKLVKNREMNESNSPNGQKSSELEAMEHDGEKHLLPPLQDSQTSAQSKSNEFSQLSIEKSTEICQSASENFLPRLSVMETKKSIIEFSAQNASSPSDCIWRNFNSDAFSFAKVFPRKLSALHPHAMTASATSANTAASNCSANVTKESPFPRLKEFYQSSMNKLLEKKMLASQDMKVIDSSHGKETDSNNIENCGVVSQNSVVPHSAQENTKDSAIHEEIKKEVDLNNESEKCGDGNQIVERPAKCQENAENLPQDGANVDKVSQDLASVKQDPTVTSDEKGNCSEDSKGFGVDFNLQTPNDGEKISNHHNLDNAVHEEKPICESQITNVSNGASQLASVSEKDFDATNRNEEALKMASIPQKSLNDAKKIDSGNLFPDPLSAVEEKADDAVEGQSLAKDAGATMKCSKDPLVNSLNCLQKLLEKPSGEIRNDSELAASRACKEERLFIIPLTAKQVQLKRSVPDNEFFRCLELQQKKKRKLENTDDVECSRNEGSSLRDPPKKLCKLSNDDSSDLGNTTVKLRDSVKCPRLQKVACRSKILTAFENSGRIIRKKKANVASGDVTKSKSVLEKRIANDQKQNQINPSGQHFQYLRNGVKISCQSLLSTKDRLHPPAVASNSNTQILPRAEQMGSQSQGKDKLLEQAAISRGLKISVKAMFGLTNESYIIPRKRCLTETPSIVEKFLSTGMICDKWANDNDPLLGVLNSLYFPELEQQYSWRTTASEMMINYIYTKADAAGFLYCFTRPGLADAGIQFNTSEQVKQCADAEHFINNLHSQLRKKLLANVYSVCNEKDKSLAYRFQWLKNQFMKNIREFQQLLRIKITELNVKCEAFQGWFTLPYAFAAPVQISGERPSEQGSQLTTTAALMSDGTIRPNCSFIANKAPLDKVSGSIQSSTISTSTSDGQGKDIVTQTLRFSHPNAISSGSQNAFASVQSNPSRSQIRHPLPLSNQNQLIVRPALPNLPVANQNQLIVGPTRPNLPVANQNQLIVRPAGPNLPVANQNQLIVGPTRLNLPVVNQNQLIVGPTRPNLPVANQNQLIVGPTRPNLPVANQNQLIVGPTRPNLPVANQNQLIVRPAEPNLPVANQNELLVSCIRPVLPVQNQNQLFTGSTAPNLPVHNRNQMTPGCARPVYPVINQKQLTAQPIMPVVSQSHQSQVPSGSTIPILSKCNELPVEPALCTDSNIKYPYSCIQTTNPNGNLREFAHVNASVQNPLPNVHVNVNPVIVFAPTPPINSLDAGVNQRVIGSAASTSYSTTSNIQNCASVLGSNDNPAQVQPSKGNCPGFSPVIPYPSVQPSQGQNNSMSYIPNYGQGHASIQQSSSAPTTFISNNPVNPNLIASTQLRYDYVGGGMTQAFNSSFSNQSQGDTFSSVPLFNQQSKESLFTAVSSRSTNYSPYCSASSMNSIYTISNSMPLTVTTSYKGSNFSSPANSCMNSMSVSSNSAPLSSNIKVSYKLGENSNAGIGTTSNKVSVANLNPLANSKIDVPPFSLINRVIDDCFRSSATAPPSVTDHQATSNCSPPVDVSQSCSTPDIISADLPSMQKISIVDLAKDERQVNSNGTAVVGDSDDDLILVEKGPSDCILISDSDDDGESAPSNPSSSLVPVPADVTFTNKSSAETCVIASSAPNEFDIIWKGDSNSSKSIDDIYQTRQEKTNMKTVEELKQSKNSASKEQPKRTTARKHSRRTSLLQGKRSSNANRRHTDDSSNSNVLKQLNEAYEPRTSVKLPSQVTSENSASETTNCSRKQARVATNSVIKVSYPIRPVTTIYASYIQISRSGKEATTSKASGHQSLLLAQPPFLSAQKNSLPPLATVRTSSKSGAPISSNSSLLNNNIRELSSQSAAQSNASDSTPLYGSPVTLVCDKPSVSTPTQQEFPVVGNSRLHELLSSSVTAQQTVFPPNCSSRPEKPGSVSGPNQNIDFIKKSLKSMPQRPPPVLIRQRVVRTQGGLDKVRVSAVPIRSQIERPANVTVFRNIVPKNANHQFSVRISNPSINNPIVAVQSNTASNQQPVISIRPNTFNQNSSMSSSFSQPRMTPGSFQQIVSQQQRNSAVRFSVRMRGPSSSVLSDTPLQNEIRPAFNNQATSQTGLVAASSHLGSSKTLTVANASLSYQPKACPVSAVAHTRVPPYPPPPYSRSFGLPYSIRSDATNFKSITPSISDSGSSFCQNANSLLQNTLLSNFSFATSCNVSTTSVERTQLVQVPPQQQISHHGPVPSEAGRDPPETESEDKNDSAIESVLTSSPSKNCKIFIYRRGKNVTGSSSEYLHTVEDLDILNLNPAAPQDDPFSEL